MNDLYEGVELNAEQTTWICRGLLDLAAVDGVHENEVALIKQFYSKHQVDFFLQKLVKDKFKHPFVNIGSGKGYKIEQIFNLIDKKKDIKKYHIKLCQPQLRLVVSI